MSVNFLRPVRVPGIVLVKSRVVRKQGRKIFVRGAIEDEDGEFFFFFLYPGWAREADG